MTDAENSSFKFALTFLAAVGTILYAVYNYFQTKSIHLSWFSYVVASITILLIASFFIIAYVLVKGMTLEVKHPQKVINLNKFANDFYLMAFLMGISLLPYPVINLLLVRFQISIPYKDILIYLLIGFIIVLTFFKFFKKWENKFIIYFAIFIFAFIVLNDPISVLFRGNVEINMDNIYYKNSSLIPVSIEITGVNDELSIDLCKSSANKLIPIGNITLGPNHKYENIYGDNLIGNGFYSGKYYIFIETTNMTEGYYELVYKRKTIDEYPYGKSFYLVNNGSK